MASSATHRIYSSLIVGSVVAAVDYKQNGKLTWRTPTAASLAWVTATLPDYLEPAIHSHHRQFFHSVSFGGLVLYAMNELKKWQANSDAEQALKELLLTISGSYVTHLGMDSLTPRGLPVIGGV